MQNDLLESARPDFDAETAARLAEIHFGVIGVADGLAGERDRNFSVTAADRRYAMKIGNVAEGVEAVDMQIRAMEHALKVDPHLPIPAVIRSHAGLPLVTIDSPQGTHPVSLVSFMPGVAPPPPPTAPAYRRRLATVVARLSQAMRGFDHPAARRHLLWDVTRLEELAPCLDYVAGADRDVVARQFHRLCADVLPRLEGLPAQLVYGDAHAGNVLVDSSDPELVTGLVDFGDATWGPRVLDVAITAAYQTFQTDPLDALVHTVSAYHVADPLTRAEIELVPDLALARLVQSYLITTWRAAIHPENSDYILDDNPDSFDVIAKYHEIDRDEVTSRLLAGCGMGQPHRRRLDEALTLRAERLGPALTLSYESPVRLHAGDGVWLEDVDGARLLDAYNNVPHVGHCHPQVTAAIAAQVGRLTTNTRYLVDEVAEYADRLVGLLPDHLTVVMFVNSGSEANDVAYQICKAVTGNAGLITTEHAYHGTTFATSQMSPEELGTGPLERWSARLGGAETVAAAGSGERVAGELAAAVESLESSGHRPGMVILDSVFSSEGVFDPSPAYLAAVASEARRHGALFVADEVQAGFGRVGSRFWGFNKAGIRPDIVTMGKPMGNGHPMGAVVTTAAIASEFASKWHFFSTFAGSPVAAAAGSAVLDVLETERLPERGDEVGGHLRSRIAELGDSRVVAVRGAGLFTGVQMTDAAVASEVVERLRRASVLIGRTGKAGDVLKIRPPMVFSRHHADLVVEKLAETLASL